MGLFYVGATLAVAPVYDSMMGQPQGLPLLFHIPHPFFQNGIKNDEQSSRDHRKGNHGQE